MRALSPWACSPATAEVLPLVVRLPLSMIIGGLAAAVVGLVVGLPALRLKGDYLAIVTLGCGEIIKTVITNLEITGGAKGLNTGAIYSDTRTLLPYAIVAVFLVVLVMMNLKNSRHGRAIMAIRDNRIAAESNGVDVTYYKLMVFILAAFFAGMAGTLYGHTLANIKPAMFDYNSSIEILVLVVLVRQLFLYNYEGAFFCILTILLLYVPSWIQVKLHIELPPALEITILCFIFAAEILGEVNAFYTRVPNWDTMLHTLNGFLAAAVGFSMVLLLNDNERLTFDLSPFFLALVAFCFSMTIGVLWEFFEFGMDYFFHTDMQKDTVVNALYTVALDPTRTNKVVAVKGIQDVVINGESLGLGGYLDIGIIDTMKDLFVNFIGAVVFSITGFFYARSKGEKRTPAQNFVPSKKTEETDYLKQAREKSRELSGQETDPKEE